MCRRRRRTQLILTDFLAALLVALVLTGLFIAVFRRGGPWSLYVAFFVVVLLAAWTGGVWSWPAGPAFYGVHWVPFLAIGTLVALGALLICSRTHPQPPMSGSARSLDAESGGAHAGAVAAVTLTWFLWLVLIGLMLAIFLGYVWGGSLARPETA